MLRQHCYLRVGLVCARKRLKIGSRQSCKATTARDQPQTEELVFNEVKIQMLSRELQSVLFGSVISKYGPPPRSVSADLEAHGINLQNPHYVRPPIRFPLPPLHGADIKEHFFNVAQEMIQPYVKLLTSFPSETPPMPQEWSQKPGWTRYSNGHSSSVTVPLEDVVVFDTEVILAEGNAPTMAVALSPIAWYSWVSPTLTQSTCSSGSIEPLIRLCADTNQIKCVIGHFVSFDRARIEEEYRTHGTKTRFVDTLALHVAVSGLTSTQRHLKTTANKQLFNNKLWQKFMKDHGTETTNGLSEKSNMMDLQWIEQTSLNNLTDVYKLYCAKDPPQDKTARSVFVTGTREEVCSRFQELMRYCATDVLMTFEIFQNLFPLFQKRFPHPATLYGLLEMGSMYLPITDTWLEFQTRADQAFADNERRQRTLLMQLAEQALERYSQPDSDPTTDPWLWDLDWSKPRVTSIKTEADKKLASLPKWYRDLIPKPVKNNVNAGPSLLTTQMRIAPKLLRLCWQGLPIHFDQELKWGVLIPGRAPQPYGDPRYYEQSSSHPPDARETTVGNMQPNFPSYQIRASIPVYKRATAGETELHFPYRAYLDYWLTEMKRKLLSDAGSLIEQQQSADSSDRKLATAYAQRIVPNSRDDQLMDELQRSIQAMPLDYEDRVRLVSTIAAIRTMGAQRDVKQHGRHTESAFKQDSQKPIYEHLGEMQARGPAFWLDAKRYDRNGSTASDYKRVQPRRRGGGTHQMAVDTVNPSIPCCWFCHLPHESGEGVPVGSPLSRAFQSHIAANRLHSADALITAPLSSSNGATDVSSSVGPATQLLRDRVHATFWQSYSKRVKSQMAVWLQSNDLPSEITNDPAYNSGKKYGAILPQVITSGTVSRRAVEPLWLTASNADRNRLGSEIKAMVQAPPGYCFVGADVDSQEMWIAALIGDASVGFQGATPYGWMTLEGNKQDGTDLHTKIARIMGITRGEAKVLNYARLYGSGFEFTKHLLAKFSNLTPEQASLKASQLLRTTKGQRVSVRSVDDQSDIKSPAWRASSVRLGNRTESQWQGGTESAVFNQLERIARSPEPRTPVLNAQMTRALNPRLVKEDFLPSRINWVVQSSAVDYLHCMLVIMGWLIHFYQLPARLCISIHDEVRYLCRRDAAERVALALQISNLFTRCLFAYQLGMRDLPESVAYFSSVEIDTCLRKNPNDDCITPSNPDGMQKTYNIQPGESLTMQEILNRTGGSLENH